MARGCSSVGMTPITMLGGVAQGDFVDEAMEDQLNLKDDEKEDLQVDSKNCEKKEEIASRNTSCSDEKQMHSSSFTEANKDNEIIAAMTNEKDTQSKML